jgi:hypothetical protein
MWNLLALLMTSFLIIVAEWHFEHQQELEYIMIGLFSLKSEMPPTLPVSSSDSEGAVPLSTCALMCSFQFSFGST